MAGLNLGPEVGRPDECSLWGWTLCRDHSVVYLGDKNALNLSFHAQNRGEGGAYEAELHVIIPPEADYIGVLRNHGVGNIPCPPKISPALPKPLTLCTANWKCRLPQTGMLILGQISFLTWDLDS